MRIATQHWEPTQVSYSVDDQITSISSPEPILRATGEAQVALGLLPALLAGRPLEIDQPVTPRFHTNLKTLRRIFGSWLERDAVEVIAAVADPRGVTPATGVGCFFSGGVDSFYSVLRHADEITALIFVHGFDIGIGDRCLGASALRHARSAARALGKDLLEIRTDLRSQPWNTVDWEYGYGPAMAMVAHSLSGTLGRVYIPASFTYKEMFPAGSHPMTDPLWSGPVELIHDGADMTRMAKMAYLADSEVAAEHLRVCWENRGGRFNCCECDKCTRTMVALRVLGVLDRFRTFDRPLRLGRFRYEILRDDVQALFIRQILAEAQARGSDRVVINALRWRLRIGPKRQTVRRNGYRLYRALRGGGPPETAVKPAPIPR